MSIELTHYIERRILNLLSFAMELREKLPYSSVNFVLSNQITRKIKMAEEVYEKAKVAEGKDFVFKMTQAKREMRETKYWVKILKSSEGRKPHQTIGFIEDESEALIRIFGRILSINN
ncbi:MAG: four helix bundle protein [Candidatus Levybacteria bacterium]|nr:four helix bundle protein [Candidatus Levybacteria bacterium]